MMDTSNTKFEISVYNKDQIPNNEMPVIALLGKSNVGKSSFINALFNNRNLAKIGNTPGKTRCMNFFNIDSKFYVVDMPGYGYSTMSKSEKESINKLVHNFLVGKSSQRIKLCILILDIRHKATKDDKNMYEWLLQSEIPFILVANKLDKIPKTKVDEYLKEITLSLFAKEEILYVSSDKKINFDIIKDRIDIHL